MKEKVAGYISRGIGDLDALQGFLPEFSRFKPISRLQRPAVDCVLGWGLNPMGLRARQLATRNRLPYLALEDGYLRSPGLNLAWEQPHSLVADTQGIYYDASRPSDLENLIINAEFSENELEHARHCMALIARYRLSKYNHAPDLPVPETRTRQRVLVVDQTRDDASIYHGGANARTFSEMLTCALLENPDAEVLIKVHPEVISGSKKGHFEHAAHPRCRLIAVDMNPWSLLDVVDTVYVVTSQLGFDALLANKRVVCHGLPFFAGWGLTVDRQICHRRNVKRSLEKVFAAAYMRYSRYANPYTGQVSTLEDTIALIADQRRQRDRLAGEWIACHFSRWKRTFVGDFLGARAQYRYRHTFPHLPRIRPETRLLAWSSDIDDKQRITCQQARVPLWQVEDGFLRSVGLGTDLVRPCSLVLDRRGMYYDPSRASDLEHLLEHSDITDDLIERAANLRRRLVRMRLSKYNIPSLQSLPPKDGRLRILLPGQVETDAAIQASAGEIRTNRDLLAEVRRKNPEACILYKPHPDVTSGARLGELEPADRELYDIEVGNVDIATLLGHVDEVHTICSLTGFEALMRGREVVTYGLPFYAGWGLTRDNMTCSRRRRRLSLEQLIAVTLILYPTYVDPRTRQICNVETVVGLLEQQRMHSPSPGLTNRLYRYCRNTFAGRS